jgi:hypothetical protein
MRSLKTSLFACLALVAMTAAASAQMQSGSQIGNRTSKAENAKAATDSNDKVKANDKAYNAALKNLPDKPYDPWQGAR